MSASRVEKEGVRFTDSPRRGPGADPGASASYEPLLHEPPPPLGMPADVAPVAPRAARNERLAAGVNMAKAILGVGILALPRVVSLLGMGTATIWLVFMALLTYASMHFLTKASVRTGLLGYSDVVREQLGLAGQVFLDIAVIVNGFGMMVIYLVIAGDILVGNDDSSGGGNSLGKKGGEGGGSGGLLSPECGDRRTVLAVITLLLLAPLVSATRTRATTGASALGVTAILIWSIATLLLFLVAASNGDLQPMHWWPESKTFKSKGFESAVQMVAVLPVLTIAYMCQMSMGHAMRDLSYIREGQMDKVSSVALTISTTAFLIISVCSYGLFERVQPDVLRNFTVDALTAFVWTRLAQAVFMLVRLSFLVSLLASFPLHMHPFRDSLWMLLFRQTLQGPGFWLVTYLALFGVYWAAAYITSIWEPLIILGSTAGVLIAFIFPGLLAASLEEELTESTAMRRTRGVGGALLVLVGLVIGVAGIVRVIFYRDPIGG
ncbi:hypothetical protein ABPG75_011596 [Micractinium tetrahymenae]